MKRCSRVLFTTLLSAILAGTFFTTRALHATGPQPKALEEKAGQAHTARTEAQPQQPPRKKRRLDLAEAQPAQETSSHEAIATTSSLTTHAAQPMTGLDFFANDFAFEDFVLEVAPTTPLFAPVCPKEAGSKTHFATSVDLLEDVASPFGNLADPNASCTPVTQAPSLKGTPAVASKLSTNDSSSTAPAVSPTPPHIAAMMAAYTPADQPNGLSLCNLPDEILVKIFSLALEIDPALQIAGKRVVSYNEKKEGVSRSADERKNILSLAHVNQKCRHLFDRFFMFYYPVQWDTFLFQPSPISLSHICQLPSYLDQHQLFYATQDEWVNAAYLLHSFPSASRILVPTLCSLRLNSSNSWPASDTWNMATSHNLSWLEIQGFQGLKKITQSFNLRELTLALDTIEEVSDHPSLQKLTIKSKTLAHLEDLPGLNTLELEDHQLPQVIPHAPDTAAPVFPGLTTLKLVRCHLVTEIPAMPLETLEVIDCKALQSINSPVADTLIIKNCFALKDVHTEETLGMFSLQVDYPDEIPTERDLRKALRPYRLLKNASDLPWTNFARIAEKLTSLSLTGLPRLETIEGFLHLKTLHLFDTRAFKTLKNVPSLETLDIGESHKKPGSFWLPNASLLNLETPSLKSFVLTRYPNSFATLSQQYLSKLPQLETLKILQHSHTLGLLSGVNVLPQLKNLVIDARDAQNIFTVSHFPQLTHFHLIDRTSWFIVSASLENLKRLTVLTIEINSLTPRALGRAIHFINRPDPNHPEGGIQVIQKVLEANRTRITAPPCPAYGSSN